MIDKLSWIAVYPEIVLLVMACVIALVDLGVKTPGRTLTYLLTLVTLGVVAAMEASYALGGQTFYGFGNMVVVDAMGSWLKCLSSVTLMAAVVQGRAVVADPAERSAVADVGLIRPPEWAWVEPKVADGMVNHGLGGGRPCISWRISGDRFSPTKVLI